MISKVISDFLRGVGSWPVYFEGDNVWSFGSPVPRPGPQRIASLSALLMSKLKQVAQSERISKALKNIATINEIEFCLCQLIPYLRFLDTGHPEDLVCSPELKRSLSSLTQRANALEPRFKKQPPNVTISSQIYCLLGIPCAVFAGVVIPIHRVASSAMRPDVTINGTHYRYSPHRIRQLRTVLLGIDKALETTFAHNNSVPSDEMIAVQRCFEFAGSILTNFCQPVQRGIYQVIYKDHQYELHYSGGKFMLVIGSLQSRINQQSQVYVGVPITARSHLHQPRAIPIRATTPEGLWADVGLPISPNMCLGGRHQFLNLRTSISSDVETILAWLDVGVNLATGRTAYHQLWRSRKNSLNIQKRKQLTRG